MHIAGRFGADQEIDLELSDKSNIQANLTLLQENATFKLMGQDARRIGVIDLKVQSPSTESPKAKVFSDVLWLKVRRRNRSFRKPIPVFIEVEPRTTVKPTSIVFSNDSIQESVAYLDILPSQKTANSVEILDSPPGVQVTLNRNKSDSSWAAEVRMTSSDNAAGTLKIQIGGNDVVAIPIHVL